MRPRSGLLRFKVEVDARNMMKKTIQTLLLVLSVVISVFVTVSARARSNPKPAPWAPVEIHAQIRWKKAMGLIPIGPGKILASNSACSPFFVVAYEYNKNFDSRDLSKVIAYSSRSTSQPTEQEEYYVCDYSIEVPADKSMFARAGIGDADLLPKMSRQSYYVTDPWIGGTNSRPPAGWERGLVERPKWEGSRYLDPAVFEMIYVQSDPSSTSEIGSSPLLRRPLNFAGAWQGKLGDGALELILQQAGNQVTGQVKVNSAVIGVIREGTVVANTLRFKIVRGGRTFGVRTDEFVGTGELVLDEGGQSFTGTVLGAVTSGTLLSR